jgi:hypothetical protein
LNSSILGSFAIEDIMVNDIYLFILLITITSIGSLGRNMLFTSKKYKPSISRSLMAAIMMSLLLLFSSGYLIKYLPGKSFLFIAMICGILSIDIINKLSTFKGLKDMLQLVFDIVIFIKNRNK